MNASKELERLFEAERLERAPDASRREAWQRLQGALAANAPAMAIGTGPLEVGLSILGKGIIVTSVTALALGGATWSLTPHAPSEARSPAPAVIATSEAPKIADVAQTSPSEPSPSLPAPPGSTRAPSAKPSADSTFEAELRLIQLAKAELDTGQARRAESWLAEHARQFPNGVFAAERQALLVLTGCATLGDPAAKRARGAEFARRNPGSPLLDRVLRACGAPAAEGAPSRASFEIDEGAK
jgi:hypothetical protein